jgi:hypothetical protein
MGLDMRKFATGFLRPDDVRDGARVEKIVNVYEHEKYNRPVLDLESGAQFTLNESNTRILNKAWGFDSDDFLDQELELSLGHYKDWREDPPVEKETVVVRPLSPAKPTAGNGAQPRPRPAPPVPVRGVRSDMDDEIPF